MIASMFVLGTTWEDIRKLLLVAIAFVVGFFLAGVVHSFVQERIKNEWVAMPIGLGVGAITVHRLLNWAVRQAKDHPQEEESSSGNPKD